MGSRDERVRPGVGLMKRAPIKSTSVKRRREDALRRKVVAWLRAVHPICEVPWCDRPSTDAHEPLTRARGGSITDPANIRMVCRLHHDLIHLEDPIWYETGFLKHSWEK